MVMNRMIQTMSDVQTPQALFEQYQASIANELSKGFTKEQSEQWIIQVCNSLCKGRPIAFMAQFAGLLRNSIDQVSQAKSASNSTANGSSHTEMNGATITKFDPQAWKTIKVHRDDWVSTTKAIKRADKQRNNPIRIVELD
jgi:hypothetical protein